MIDTLNVGRGGVGAQMIGIAQRARTVTISLPKERQQLGKPHPDSQGIQFQIAQAATELEAARLMAYDAERLRDAGQDNAKEGVTAKLYLSQICERVTSLRVELVDKERVHPDEKFYRDAKIGMSYEGTGKMQLQAIANAVLS